jgi:hypothetical protein
MATRECENCGHGMRMMQFANETSKKLTCPDCGWRPGKPTGPGRWLSALEAVQSTEPSKEPTMTTTNDTSRFAGASNAEAERLTAEVEGMIEAGASNAEIRQSLALSDDGYLNVIRVLLEELWAYRPV